MKIMASERMTRKHVVYANITKTYSISNAKHGLAHQLLYYMKIDCREVVTTGGSFPTK